VEDSGRITDLRINLEAISLGTSQAADFGIGFGTSQSVDFDTVAGFDSALSFDTTPYVVVLVPLGESWYFGN